MKLFLNIVHLNSLNQINENIVKELGIRYKSNFSYLYILATHWYTTFL